MARFEVHFLPATELKIGVDIEPEEDEDPDDLRERAIELAHQRIPENLVCAQDSGWGQKNYWLDVSATDIEPYAVYDGEGTLVYEQKGIVDLLNLEIHSLESRLGNALAELTKLRDDAGLGLHKALEPIEKALRGTR